MQKSLVVCVVAGLFTIVILVTNASISFTAPISLAGTAEVYFSPHGGATDAVIREISAAKNEIEVQAYSFTSVPIAKALLAAKNRGVRVQAVLDKSQQTQRYTSATFLKNAGIPVFIDRQHAIAHNKVIIIDGYTLITGSFNFTKAAEEKNAENLIVIKSNKPFVNKYLGNFQVHKGHSEIY